jgi:hypothetical protein
LADELNKQGVKYLFIGKSGAILLGYPDTTQHVDLYIPKDRVNAEKLVAAFDQANFPLSDEARKEILAGKDLCQLKDGPFDADVITQPDGIANFETAWARRIQEGKFPVANLKDIINSKKSANRVKDREGMARLEAFAREWEKSHVPELLSAHETVLRNSAARQDKGE